jgi:mannose-1-phosphate guanylyltransferase
MAELKKTVLIMAGGRGTRFWPKSRKNLPKQFLSLTGSGETMIQLTVKRLLPIIDINDIYISTNEDYRRLVRQQLPELPEKNILCEPAGRNTAPCIGLGAVHMAEKYGDAVMFVLPSDHEIKMPGVFRDTLLQAAEVAEQGRNIVTIGIPPTYPETGYGYIKYLTDQKIGTAYRVDRFVEKPDLEKAEAYLVSGEYLWNAGQFVWKVSTILADLNRYMPGTYQHLCNIRAAISKKNYNEVLCSEFALMESQSIDYGVMEKDDRIFVIPGNFGWDDVGSWLAIERLQQKDSSGNVLNGDIISLGCSGCTIQGHKKLIAAVGLRDTVIVDTGDALLVCSKEHTGEIKRVMAQLEEKGRNELL